MKKILVFLSLICVMFPLRAFADISIKFDQCNDDYGVAEIPYQIKNNMDVFFSLLAFDVEVFDKDRNYLGEGVGLLRQNVRPNKIAKRKIMISSIECDEISIIEIIPSENIEIKINKEEYFPFRWHYDVDGMEEIRNEFNSSMVITGQPGIEFVWFEG